MAKTKIPGEYLVDGGITTAKIADDSVTLAKMAGLARGKIIYGDASGNPAALALGTNGQVLKSDGTDIAWATDAAGTITGVSNFADNRVVTSSGSTTLNGEANLTFDGTTTVINNTGNADSTLLKLTNTPSTAGTYKTGIEFWSNEGTAANQTFNAGRIYSEFNGSNYSNAGLTLGSALGNGTFNDELTLRNGNVGIGTSLPEAKLDVKSTFAITEASAANSNSELTFYSKFSDSQRGFVLLRCESLASGSSDLAFRTRNSFVEAERFRIQAGGGISFNGDTAAANALDDYEEGTWTGTLKGETEPGTLITATGLYTKIGRMVNYTLGYENVDTSGYAGAISVNGLPFTNNGTRSAGAVGTYYMATWNTATELYTLIAIGETKITVQSARSSDTWAQPTHLGVSQGFMWLQGTYITNS
jgi:hypothetical protein